jgi:dienelactone hydrolase
LRIDLHTVIAIQQAVLTRLLSCSAAFLCAVFAVVAAQPTYATRLARLGLPSQQPDGTLIELNAYWFASDKARDKAPAVVLLHGCGGAYDRTGALLNPRFVEYAQLINDQGYHAVIVDSLKPRNEAELCTQKTGERKVTQAHRRIDALKALEWLAARPDVDASRLVLLGWSNGGSTVLAATNRNVRAVREAKVKPRAAIAFYPGCEAELKRGYAAIAPLLAMPGELDDWTPAAPCVDLGKQSSEGAKVEVQVMAGSYHSYDTQQKLRVRKDVPNGVNPGQGVHVGGNAAARERSRQLLLDFLQRELR